MLTPPIVSDVQRNSHLIRRWRCGRIRFSQGRFCHVQRKYFAGSVSVAQVWWQAHYGRRKDDEGWLDYHQPLGMPGFLTLDYLSCGRQAGYATLSGLCHALDQIAKIRRAVAIVAHVTNGRISDRFLTRMGWQPHCESMRGRHWIRRFYDGYPDPPRRLFGSDFQDAIKIDA